MLLQNKKQRKRLSIFDRARIAAEKKYLNNSEKKNLENSETLYSDRLRNIEYYERKYSSGDFFERIKYTAKLYWYMIPEDWKICVEFIIGFFIFVCCVCLVCIEFLTPMFFLEQWIGIGEVVFPICTICFIVSAIKDRKFFKSRAFYFSWLLSFLLFLPNVPIYMGYGTTQIGDFYEKKDYTEEYMVIMSQKPQTNPNRKEYTLPATIYRCEDYLDTTSSTHYITGERSEKEIYGYQYHIEKLYFSNGGYLTFDEGYNVVHLNEEVKLYDRNNNDTYYITLTDQKYND